MKKAIILTLMFIIFINSVSARDYHVTESGAGADFSAAGFNALSGNYAGDTFYFSGDFSTRLNVKLSGTNGNPVTLDGYKTGDCDPLYSVCTSSALLYKGMMLDATYADNEYIVIQDFRMTFTGNGCFNTIGGALHLASTYQQPGSNNHIIIRRNFIDDTAAAGVKLGHQGEESSYLIFEENKVTNFHVRCNIAESAAFIIAKYNHVLIRNNIFGHDNNPRPNCPTGCNTLTMHEADDLLFEYNDVYGAPHQAGMSAKEFTDGNYRHIWRFNKVHDNGEWGMANSPHNTPPNEYFYVYGNYVYNNGRVGIEQYDGSDYGYYWSNIIANNGDHAFNTWERGAGSPDYIYIFNNIVARNGKTGPWHTELGKGGITFTAGSKFTLKNNLLYNNREDGLGYYHQIYDANQNAVLEHNTLYHSSGNPTWWYGNGARDLQTMQNTYEMEDDYPQGTVEDPLFTDPDGQDNIHGTVDDDYTLKSNSPSINKGANLDECFSVALSGGDSWFEAQTGYSTINMCLSDALHPSTDWTTTPPTIVTANQNDYGSGWERGAYVYVEGGTETCTNYEYYCCDSCQSGNEDYPTLSPTCSGKICCNSCSTTTPTCQQGQITSTCLCGGTERSSGYCCSGSWQSTTCTTIPSDYKIIKTSSPPIIDGILSEFNNANIITLTNSQGTTGKYKLMWDETALYIATEITDSKLNAQYTNEDANLYEDDSLEIMFDTLNDGGNQFPKNDDYKFFVNINDAHTDSRVYDNNWDSQITHQVKVVGTINQNTDQDTGYTIEAKIPWTNWAQPTDNQIWGMNIQLNDKTQTSLEQTTWSNLGVNIPDGWKDAIFEQTTTNTCGEADNNPPNGIIDNTEINNYILKWKDDNVQLPELIIAIDQWKYDC